MTYVMCDTQKIVSSNVGSKAEEIDNEVECYCLETRQDAKSDLFINFHSLLHNLI